MKLGRVAVAPEAVSWAILDPAAGTATVVDGPIAAWGPTIVAGDAPPLGATVPYDDAMLRIPIETTGRVLGVGANYRVHLARFGVELPAEPVSYLKPVSALVPPGGAIVYPATTSELDFEVEMVVVIGGDNGEVLGVTVGNDVSARDAHSPFGGPDLFSMKALDNSTPVGPWITTIDELGGALALDLEIGLSVNGELRQRDRTSEMVFSVERILAYLDARVQLRPGDLVFTGTTAGVGMEDGRFLRPGDEVVAWVEGVGELRASVVPPGPRPIDW